MPRSEERESDSPAYFSSIFSPGTMVRVDREERVRRPDSEGGYAYVTSGSSVENRISTVKYTVNGLTSPNVDHARLHPTGFQEFYRRGPRIRRRPNFLSSPPQPRQLLVSTPSSLRKRKKPDTIYDTIEHSRAWTPILKKPHPLLKKLLDGKAKEEGWLRRELAAEDKRPEPQKESHLRTPEKTLLTQIAGITNSLTPSKHPAGSNPTGDHAHAWGTSKRTISTSDKRTLKRKMDSSRKRRSDEGRSVFNCPKRRDSTYTPLDNFKRRKRFDNPGEPFDPKELRIEFEQLTGPCRIPYERGAEEIGEALWKAVKRVYEDYDIKKLSQLYMHHGQIVNAILKCKGGDEFVKESKALHCGVRSIVQPVYDNEESKTPCGVEILESLSPIDVAAKLRYKRPNVSKQFWEAASHEDDHDFNPKKYLSRHMLELFCENSVDDDLEHQYFSEALRELNEADENANNEEGNSDGNGNNGEDGSGSNSGSQNDNNNGGGGRNNDDRNDSDLQGCHF